MTIERSEDVPVTVFCDRCGERLPLDVDHETTDTEVVNVMRAEGWQRGPIERQRFDAAIAPYSVLYEDDRCPDCIDDDSGSRAKFGADRKPAPRVAGFGADDPCDEWPRAAVFTAIGLRPDCGHPRQPRDFGHCGYCERGFPIGRVDVQWRR